MLPPHKQIVTSEPLCRTIGIQDLLLSGVSVYMVGKQDTRNI